MRRTLVISLFMIGLAAALIIFSVYARGVQAQSRAAKEPQPVVGSQNLTLEPDTLKPVPPNATRIPDMPEDPTRLGEINDLIANLKTKIPPAGQSGWYHLAWMEVSDPDTSNNGVLPDGTEIPASYTTEVWCRVDDRGFVTQRVTIMKTLAGEVFQVSVRAEGKDWNSATGETLAGDPYPFADLLTGIHARIASDAAVGAVEVQQIEGRVEFTSFEEYQNPVKLLELEKEVVRSEAHYSIDANSGLMISIETIFTLVDGSRRTLASSTMTLFEPVSQPPAEVLGYLENQDVK